VHRFLHAMANSSSSIFFCGNRADPRRLAVPNRNLDAAAAFFASAKEG
jgi:hypothetical protein